MRQTLNTDHLRDILEYNASTGIFRWKRSPSNSVKAGAIAGNPDGSGYLQINLRGIKYYAHRLAWMYMYGEFQENDIDHINGKRDDNRIENLRNVPKSVNQQNFKRATSRNKTGLLGVSKISANGKYRASIGLNGSNHFLGEYENKEIAHAIYLKAKRHLHDGCTI